jgi:hypothetical protein
VHEEEAWLEGFRSARAAQAQIAAHFAPPDGGVATLTIPLVFDVAP